MIQEHIYIIIKDMMVFAERWLKVEGKGSLGLLIAEGHIQDSTWHFT